MVDSLRVEKRRRLSVKLVFHSGHIPHRPARVKILSANRGIIDLAEGRRIWNQIYSHRSPLDPPLYSWKYLAGGGGGDGGSGGGGGGNGGSGGGGGGNGGAIMD